MRRRRWVRPISEDSKIGVAGTENLAEPVLLTIFGVVPEEGRPLFSLFKDPHLCNLKNPCGEWILNSLRPPRTLPR
jgi:hypothetical protein